MFYNIQVNGILYAVVCLLSKGVYREKKSEAAMSTPITNVSV